MSRPATCRVFLAGALLLALAACRQDPGTAGTPGTPPDSSDTAVPGTIVADHGAAAAFADIPAAAVETAKSTFRIFCGHTSHGSQIITGLDMLHAEDSRYAYNTGSSSLGIQEEWADLGHEGNLDWVDITRVRLDPPDSGINMVVWSWCAGVSDNTSAGINAYLDAMNQLERDYPAVTFVYMTGHLDGSGAGGNLRARNNQIRAYCRAHGKKLFDFADIESYDPDGNYYPDGTDRCEWCESWCAAHECPSCDECAHSVCFNCYQKGKAFWWLLARLAGWNPA